MKYTKWIIDQTASIIEEKDKIFYNDIIKCYASNLLRACYLLIWIGIAESLKKKLLYKKYNGLIIAKNAIDIIISEEKKHSSVDKIIVEKATNCGIITGAESSQINSIWVKRCIFAHPYNTNPTEIDIKEAIEKLIIFCYSKPNYLTEDEINKKIDEFCDISWSVPSSMDEQDIYFRDIALSIREKDKHLAFKYALGKISNISEKKQLNSNDLTIIIYVRKFLLILTDNLTTLSSKMGINGGITYYPCTAWLCFSQEKIWSKLSPDHRDKMFRFVTNQTDKFNIFCFLIGCKYLIADNLLNTEEKGIYYNALKQNHSITNCIHLFYDKSYYLDWIFEELINGNNFGKQGIFIDILGNYKEELTNHFNNPQLFTLGEYLCRCVLNNTYRAQDFIIPSNIEFMKGYISYFLIGFLKNPYYLHHSIKYLYNILDSNNQNDLSSFINELIVNKKQFVIENNSKNEIIRFISEEKVKNSDKSYYYLFGMLESLIATL